MQRSHQPSWWGSILAGAFVMFLSWCAFGYFTRLEQGGADPTTMPGILVFLYRIGGRWGVLVGGGLMGLLAIAGGVRQLVAPNDGEA